MKLIRKNAFMIKIDIKDAYYSVPIADVDQKYFKFLHNGQLYKYTALPNGFSPGPRKFTKIVKVPLATLATSLETNNSAIVFAPANSFNLILLEPSPCEGDQNIQNGALHRDFLVKDLIYAR